VLIRKAFETAVTSHLSNETAGITPEVTSHVNKLGGGVNDLTLPHFLINMKISLIDLINMQNSLIGLIYIQIILIYLIIMQIRLDGIN